MPEWESLLREKLGRLRVPPARAGEIVAEIGTHLRSAWEDEQKAGKTTADCDAFLRAHLGNIARLRAGIERAEDPGGTMKRLWYLWIPALFGILSVLVGPNGMGVLPLNRWFMAHGSTNVHYERAVAYVLIAGLAALIARHTGATQWAAFTSGVLVLWRVVMFVLLTFYFYVVHPLPVTGLYSTSPRNPFSVMSAPMPRDVFWAVLLDAAVTAACYAAGALLFSRLRVVKQPAQPGVIHA